MLVSEVKTKIVYWMRRTFDQKTLENFTDAEFLEVLNQVAIDLNSKADLRMERYYNKTTAATTNYELQGKILKILYFGYEAYGWEDQYYSFVEDVVVLKESPDGDIQLDVRYVRDIEKVLDDNGEIDLPDHVLSDYLDLVKEKLKMDLGLQQQQSYHALLSAWAIIMANKTHTLPLKSGTFRYWALPEQGDDEYDITDHYVSQDSIVADVDGDYHFMPD